MSFASYHPGINLLFFVAVITGTVLFNHPVCLVISFACAFVCSLTMNHAHALALDIGATVFAVCWGAFYALYMHFGVTPLAVDFIGNSVTLEAAAAGCAQGFQIATVFIWLTCLVAVFTVDKVVYLLGRVSPKAALLVAVAARLLPLCGARMTSMKVAQAGIGYGPGQGSVARRWRHGRERVSMLATWALDHLIRASVSMRARGSSLHGRTAYALYRFDARDRSIVIVIAALIALCTMGCVLDQMQIAYNPELVMMQMTAASWMFYAAYMLLCLTPLLVQALGNLRYSLRVRTRVQGSAARDGRSLSPWC